MQCRSCGAEVQIQQGFCPGCGTFIGMPGQAQPDGKTRIWPLVSGLAFFLIIVSVVPAWMLWKSGTFRKHPPHVISKPPPEAPRREHVPAKLSELHGEGEVYLVPIGDQVIAPKSLLQHYKSKFNLTIQLLPQLPVEQKTFDAQRKQYIAEEMIEQMTLAHPDLDKDPNAVMIALTSEDIYPRCTVRSEEHTSELQSHLNLVCRLLLEKKKKAHEPPDQMPAPQPRRPPRHRGDTAVGARTTPPRPHTPTHRHPSRHRPPPPTSSPTH